MNTIKRLYTKARQTLAISHWWDLFYVKEIMLRLKIEFKQLTKSKKKKSMNIWGQDERSIV